MKRFIAFSGGVESTAMCLLYGKGATAVFTDTGNKHPRTRRCISRPRTSRPESTALLLKSN